DLSIVAFEDLVLDFIADSDQLALGDWALETGPFQPREDLVPIPRHAAAIFLNYCQPHVFLDALVSGEPLGAAHTLASPADRATSVARPAVDHLQAFLFCIAEGAAHRTARVAFGPCKRKNFYDGLKNR